MAYVPPANAFGIMQVQNVLPEPDTGDLSNEEGTAFIGPMCKVSFWSFDVDPLMDLEITPVKRPLTALGAFRQFHLAVSSHSAN